MSGAGRASAVRLEVYSGDVLEACIATMHSAIQARPLDLGVCLQSISTVSDAVTKAAGPTFDALAAGVLNEPPPCPIVLLHSASALVDFLVELHSVADANARAVENLAVNLVYKITIMTSMSDAEPALRHKLADDRALMFMLHASRMQLAQIRAGRVRTEVQSDAVRYAAHPSFVRLAVQRDYLSEHDDYLWTTCLMLLKLGRDGLEPFFTALVQQENAAGFISSLTYSTVSVLYHCVSQILEMRFRLLLSRCEESNFPLRALEPVLQQPRQLGSQDAAEPTRLYITAEGAAVVLTAAGIVASVIEIAALSAENLGVLTRVGVLQLTSTVSWMAVVTEYLAPEDSKMQHKAETLASAAVALGEVVRKMRIPRCAIPQVPAVALSLAALDALRAARGARLLGLNSLVEEILARQFEQWSANAVPGLLIAVAHDHWALFRSIPRVFAFASGRSRAELFPDSELLVFRSFASQLTQLQRHFFDEQVGAATPDGSPALRPWREAQGVLTLLCEVASPPPAASASDDVELLARWRAEYVVDACDALWQLAVQQLKQYTEIGSATHLSEAATGSALRQHYENLPTNLQGGGAAPDFSSSSIAPAAAVSFLPPLAASVEVLDVDKWDSYEAWSRSHVEPQPQPQSCMTSAGNGDPCDATHSRNDAGGRRHNPASLSVRIQQRLLGAAAAFCVDDRQLPAMRLEIAVQRSLWALNELIALCLAEGRRSEASAFCEAFAALVSHTHLSSLIASSMLVASAALLKAEGRELESLRCGIRAMQHSTMLHGNLQQHSVVERAFVPRVDHDE